MSDRGDHPRARHVRHADCLGCGYRLDGLPLADDTVRCPECGRSNPFDPDALLKPHTPRPIPVLPFSRVLFATGIVDVTVVFIIALGAGWYASLIAAAVVTLASAAMLWLHRARWRGRPPR